MMNAKITKRDMERGFALILTLVALFLLTAIALAMMFDANVETGVNANYRATQQAYFAAKAGLEEARDRLLTRSLNSSGTADPLPTPAGLPSTATANVIYLTNPLSGETVNPVSTSSYFDDELCREHFSAFSSALGAGSANVACSSVPSGNAWYQTASSDSPNTNTATAMPYKWVRITFKENDSDGLGGGSGSWVDSTQSAAAQVCWDGTRETTSCDPANLKTTPVFVLTSLAITPSKSRALLQAEVAQNPPIFVNAAVDSNSGVNIHGNLQVSGNDACTCSNPQSNSPGNLSGKTCQRMDALYSGNSVDQSGNAATFYGPVLQNQPFNYNVAGMINQFSNAPGAVTCTSGGCTTGNWGTYPTNVNDSSTGNPQISVVNGDLTLTSNQFSGNGVLVVTGNLTLHGGTTFYGLIIVGGTADLSGGGSAPVNLQGAIISGGPSSADDTLGGSYNLQYNSCAINQTISHVPPVYITSRQLDYY